MKKKIFLSLLTLVCLVCACMLAGSCSKLNAAIHCKSSEPYYCSTKNICCPYEWYDGSLYCYENYSDCIKSGGNCIKCKK